MKKNKDAPSSLHLANSQMQVVFGLALLLHHTTVQTNSQLANQLDNI
jgi:hypothetical protein